MNKIYRLKRNQTTGTLVAVQETARTKTGVKGAGATTLVGGVFRLSVLAVLLLGFLQADQLTYAAPAGGVVQAGSATILQEGLRTSITNSNGAIINWQDFSIALDELVRFQQSGANSSVLNRVVGDLPSSLLGALESNGRVFLINNHGILVGANARIDTKGLVLSTSDISDEDFLAGRMHFSGGADAGAGIRNDGDIRVDSGSVVLLGETVHNNGVITAQDGSVVLSGGNTVTLSDMENPTIQYTVSAPAGTVVNVGNILAGNGRIEIAAKSIEQEGSLDVSGANGGEVVLVATEQGSVNVTGSIDASGSSGVGGNVTIAGNGAAIILNSESIVRADGSGGGGNVTIGGTLKGGSIEIAGANLGRAALLGIASGAQVNVSATDSGDGGRTILWGDRAGIHGDLSARGGVNGGDGGFIETSGLALDVRGVGIDAAAPKGDNGKWLIDPLDLKIVSASSMTVNLSGIPVPPTCNQSSCLLATTYVSVESINAVLNNGTNVELTTSSLGGFYIGGASFARTLGNVTLAAGVDINKTSGAAATLHIDASNIHILGNISGNMNLTLTSTGGGGIVLDGSAGGGNINIGGALNLQSSGMIYGSALPEDLRSAAHFDSLLNRSDQGSLLLYNVNVTAAGDVRLAGGTTLQLASNRASVLLWNSNVTSGGNINVEANITSSRFDTSSAFLATGTMTTTNGGDINIAAAISNYASTPDDADGYRSPMVGVGRFDGESKLVLNSSGSVSLTLVSKPTFETLSGIVSTGIGADEGSVLDIHAARDISISSSTLFNTRSTPVRILSGNITAGGNIDVLGAASLNATSITPVVFGAGSNTTASTRIRAGGNISIASLLGRGIVTFGRITTVETVEQTAGRLNLSSSDMSAGNISLSGEDMTLGGNISSTGDLTIASTPDSQISTRNLTLTGNNVNLSGNISSTGDLNVAATRDLIANANITSTAGNVTMIGDNSTTVSGSIAVTGAGTVTLGRAGSTTTVSGATITAVNTYVAGEHINLNGNISSTGDLNVAATRDLIANANITSTAGNVTMIGDNSTTVSGSIAVTGAGTVTLGRAGSTTTVSGATITAVNTYVAGEHINLHGDISSTGNFTSNSEGMLLNGCVVSSLGTVSLVAATTTIGEGACTSSVGNIQPGERAIFTAMSASEIDTRVSALLRSIDIEQGPMPLVPGGGRTMMVNGVASEASGIFGATGALLPVGGEQRIMVVNNTASKDALKEEEEESQ